MVRQETEPCNGKKKRRAEASSALRAAVQQTLTEQGFWLISMVCIVLQMKGYGEGSICSIPLTIIKQWP